MTDHTWDDPDDGQPPSDLDALGFGDARHSHEDHDDSGDMSSGPVTFGVTNPAGTITAQATISGALHLIELSPSITSTTESDLARDIMATAKLANMQGRAIQRAMIQSLLMYQGMDQKVAEQFIDDIIDLPTPAQSEAAQAEAKAAYLREANTDRW
jgi:hypothetical protein